MRKALEITNLTKSFILHSNKLPFFGPKTSQKNTVLNHIHLDLMAGEILALLGPNGAGKTTLLKTIADFLIQDSGSIRVFGKELQDRTHLVSFAVGEERSFYWRLTGRENLEFFGALFSLSKKEMRQRIGVACDLFEIDYLDQRYQEYSTGMKQRLALARSYLSDAKIILLDEPTRSLDLVSAKKLRTAIQYFASEYDRAVLFSTHNAQEAESIANRIAILHQGKLAACGTMEELQRHAGANLGVCSNNDIGQAHRSATTSLEEIFETVTSTVGANPCVRPAEKGQAQGPAPTVSS